MNIILAGKNVLNEDDQRIISRNGKDSIFVCADEEGDIPIESSEVDAIICNWFFKYHNIAAFTRLKYIQLLSAGYNGIDPTQVSNLGIELNNAKDVYSIPISEFVIGNIIGFYKKSAWFSANQKAHQWEKNRELREIYGKSVLIIGTGSIGNEIAKRMCGFTENVYGCNRTVKPNALFKNVYPLEELKQIISKMDIVILSLALTNETRRIINHDIFAKMKSDVLIANVSRGDIIEQNELISFLQARPDSGAVLDVFEDEPLCMTSPLWDLENVIISPHNAFVSEKNNDRLKRLIIDNLLAWESPYEKQ